MAGRPIDELAVIISASTSQLSGDLARGAKLFRDFGAKVNSLKPPTFMDRVSGLAGMRDVLGDVQANFKRGGATAAVAGAAFKGAGAAARVAAAGVNAAFKGLAGAGNVVEKALADPIGSAKSAVAAVGGGVREAVSRTVQSVRQTWAGMRESAAASPFGPVGAALRGAGQLASAPLRGLAVGLERVGSVAGSAAGRIVGFGLDMLKTAGGVLIAQGAVAGLSGAFGLLKESVNLAADAEQTSLAFEVMLGSAEKAKAMLGSLRQFAAETPFGQKEVIDSARQLTAYGIAADQVVPTIKMLGDVASGTSTPLKDLNYLYGTLFAQQRAYAVDIRQFAGRGIPIYEELAKVLKKPVHEIKDLIEAGRIGRDEVTRAFQSMTSAGGQFYKLTERQGQTFKGRWEAMLDAFQLAKTKFGVILIEELGLKDVGNDLAGFAKKIETSMDRIRPTVRLVGDAIRSTAQGLYDVASAAVRAGPQLLKAFGLGKAGETIRGMLGDVEAFWRDPERIANLTLDIAEPFLMAFAHVRKAAFDLADFIDRNLIKPFQRFEKLTPPGMDAEFKAQVRRGDLALPPELRSTPDRFAPLGKGETAQDFAPRLVAIEKELADKLKLADVRPDVSNLSAQALDTLKGGQLPPKVAAELESLWLAYLKMLTPFEVPSFQHARHAIITEQQLPPLRQGVELGEALPKFVPPEKPKPPANPVEEMRQAIKELRESVKQSAELRRQEMRAAEARKVEQDALRQQESALAAVIGYALPTAERAMRSGQAVLGPLGMLRPPGLQPDTGEIRLQNDIPGPVHDIAKQLKKEFGNPLDPEHGVIGIFKRDAGEALKRGLIDDTLYSRGLMDVVQKEAHRLGVGGEYKLPSAATVGSAEDAKILTSWAASQMEGKPTVERLLQQIFQALQEANRRAAEAARGMQPPQPVQIRP